MNISIHVIMHAASTLFSEMENDGFPPVCLAIYDENGCMQFFSRMEKSVMLAVDISHAKARTAALMKVSTTKLHQRLQNENVTLADFCGVATTSLSGGIPLTLNNTHMGGIGISGRNPLHDEKLAERLHVLIENELKNIQP